MKKIRLLASLVMALFLFNANVSALGVATEQELVECTSKAKEICTLKNNIDLTSKLSIPKGSDITLELNGKTLNVLFESNNYKVVVGGDLTINGEGVVNFSGLYGIGTTTTSGDLTINGGTYNMEEGYYLIGSYNGVTTINGGTFNGDYCVANAFDGYNVKTIVNGGTFVVSNEELESEGPTAVLGSVYVNGGNFNQDLSESNWVTLNKDSKVIDGVYYYGDINSIKVNNSKNGVVTVNESAITGEVVTLAVKANTGYELKAVKVVDKDNKEIEITDSQFVMPDSEVTVSVDFEEIEYSVIEGSNQKVDLSSNKEVTFRIDADFSLFDKLFLDGKEVSKDNYTAKSGSTIITLKAEFAKTLSAGNHEIKAAFTNGESVITGFTVVDGTKNPKTVDSIGLYMMMFVVSVMGLGLMNFYVYKNRKSN